MVFLQSVAFVVVLAVANVGAQENPGYHAELENVRALPYGYTAVCLMPDMRIKSAGSGIFVIRNSLLCAVAVQHKGNAQRSEFVLCSNDPAHKALREKKLTDKHLPKCVDLNLSFDALEL